MGARLLNTLGWCYAEFGCHRRAARYNRQATDMAAELVELGQVAEAPELHTNAVANLAGNYVALGDLDAASELLETLQANLDRTTDPFARWRYELHVADVSARAALAGGEPERALALAGNEVAAAGRQHARKLQARALELRGSALLAMDRREEASQSHEQALGIATEISYPPATWRALSLLAELSRRAGDRAAADEHAERARKLVGSLAGSLPEPELRSEFAALADRLVSNPLAGYR